MKRYDGQVAVVTGASSGIGRRVALALAERGAMVVGMARRESLLRELGEELQRAAARERGATVFGYAVSDPERTRNSASHLV